MLMVGALENNLHPIVEELKRWQDIIGDEYYWDKAEKEAKRDKYSVGV